MVDNLFSCGFTFPPTQHTVSFETKSPIIRFVTLKHSDVKFSTFSSLYHDKSNCADRSFYLFINPLRSNSEQRQISLCNINAFSVREVTRMNNMNFLDGLKGLPVSAISNVWQQERRICSVMLEIKGLIRSSLNRFIRTYSK